MLDGSEKNRVKLFYISVESDRNNNTRRNPNSSFREPPLVVLKCVNDKMIRHEYAESEKPHTKNQPLAFTDDQELEILANATLRINKAVADKNNNFNDNDNELNNLDSIKVN